MTRSVTEELFCSNEDADGPPIGLGRLIGMCTEVENATGDFEGCRQHPDDDQGGHVDLACRSRQSATLPVTGTVTMGLSRCEAARCPGRAIRPHATPASSDQRPKDP